MSVNKPQILSVNSALHVCVYVCNKGLSVFSVCLSVYQGDLDCSCVDWCPHTLSVFYLSIHTLFLQILFPLLCTFMSSLCLLPTMPYFSTWVSVGSLAYVSVCFPLSNTQTHKLKCPHTIDGNLCLWISLIKTQYGESRDSIFCPTKLSQFYTESRHNSEGFKDTHTRTCY